MKLTRLLAVAGLLLLMPTAISGGAYSPTVHGQDPVYMTGVTVPAGMQCSGQMYKDGNHLVMDICSDGYAQSKMFPSGTRYAGHERLDMVLVPTATPGVYKVHGDSHGYVDFWNGVGRIHARVDGSFQGTMVFDQFGWISSFSLAVNGGLNILSGDGAYLGVHGGGHYTGTSVMTSAWPYVEHDTIVASVNQ